MRSRKRNGGSTRRRRPRRPPRSSSTRSTSRASTSPRGAPVVSLLPPGNVKVRFYVPETIVGARPARAPRRACAATVATAPIDVRVDFVAPQAEFTPPVIYSRENRAKLVFLVEARPAQPNARLHAGPAGRSHAERDAAR